MGTGSFLDVVTDTPHASLNGLIPLVAWRIPGEEGEVETKYLAEGSVHDTGVVMEWAKYVKSFDLSIVDYLSNTSLVNMSQAHDD